MGNRAWGWGVGLRQDQESVEMAFAQPRRTMEEAQVNLVNRMLFSCLPAQVSHPRTFPYIPGILPPNARINRPMPPALVMLFMTFCICR